MLLLFALLTSVASGQTSEDLLKTRFRTECLDAVKAWEKLVSHAEITLKLTTDERRMEPERHYEGIWRLKCKLPDMAWVNIGGDLSRKSEGDRMEIVYGFNKEYSYSLKRKGDGKEYFISSFERGPKRDIDATKRHLPQCLMAPYWMRNGYMKEWLTYPYFTVRTITPLNRNGKNLLRVEFETKRDPARPQRKGAVDSGGLEGFLVFSPEDNWVLYEFEYLYKRGKGELRKGKIDYQGIFDGFPIPKRWQVQSFDRADGKLLDNHVYDFLEFRFADHADREFTLAAFGIPEEVSRPPTVARGGALGYWMLALALATLGAAVFLRIASSRIKGSTQT